jgi:hypothetical protein
MFSMMLRSDFVALFLLAVSAPAALTAQLRPTSRLPDAPSAGHAFLASSEMGPVVGSPQGQASSAASTGVAPILLTRQQAEQIALTHNPGIRIGQLLAKAEHEVVRQSRSSLLPDLSGSLSAVQAEEGSRISAGSLTASRLVQHAGMGIQLRQLITDFGHTRNLVASAKLNEKARLADAEASRADIVLATDEVFYRTIEAEATLKVAKQTVAARQTLVDQVSALTSSKLKSDIDLGFAEVNLSEAKLLQLDAENNLDAAKAALDAVLGYDRQMDYEPVFQLRLVWRGGHQYERSCLQRIPLRGGGVGSIAPGTGRSGANARLARRCRSRCPHSMAQCQNRGTARYSDRRAAAAGRSYAQPVADAVSPRAELDCGAEPGPVAADAGRYQRGQCALAIWLRDGGFAIPDRKSSLKKR